MSLLEDFNNLSLNIPSKTRKQTGFEHNAPVTPQDIASDMFCLELTGNNSYVFTNSSFPNGVTSRKYLDILKGFSKHEPKDLYLSGSLTTSKGSSEIAAGKTIFVQITRRRNYAHADAIAYCVENAPKLYLGANGSPANSKDPIAEQVGVTYDVLATSLPTSPLSAVFYDTSDYATKDQSNIRFNTRQWAILRTKQPCDFYIAKNDVDFDGVSYNAYVYYPRVFVADFKVDI